MWANRQFLLVIIVGWVGPGSSMSEGAAEGNVDSQEVGRRPASRAVMSRLSRDQLFTIHRREVPRPRGDSGATIPREFPPVEPRRLED